MSCSPRVAEFLFVYRNWVVKAYNLTLMHNSYLVRLNLMVNIKRLNKIDWSSYQYAEDTSKHLIDLFSNDQEKVYFAIGKLEDSLCHQHVGVAPALLPAFPFLVEALHKLTDVKNLGLLLELFWGISLVTCPPDRFYSIRALDLDWTNIPSKLSEPTKSYVQEIRRHLLINRKIFTSFLNHQNDYIFEYAAIIVANFTDTPVETVKELQTALSRENNPIRRNTLFSGFRELQFENKLDYLIQAYHKETDKSVKSEIAGQIAYEMKTDSPSEVVGLLSELVLDMPESEKIEAFGIPLALARPDKYEDILKRFINYMKHLPFAINSVNFLAFALCWNGKPDFDKLDSLQLSAIETLYQKSWQGKHNYPSSSDFRYFSLPTSQDEMQAFLREHKP